MFFVCRDNPTKWVPEFAEYMVEGTPGKPYGHRIAHFNMVEANMKYRWVLIALFYTKVICLDYDRAQSFILHPNRVLYIRSIHSYKQQNKQDR